MATVSSKSGTVENCAPARANVDQLLRDRFGMSTLRDGQWPVIQSLLSGRNAAAVFPTGGGKSLCYQLPALMLPGVTLVVSPLIALMKDQCDALAARGIIAARLDSTQETADFVRMMRGIRSGQIKIVYVAPERFFNERFRASINEWQISLFAIDEAHCISQWGHSFRPDYLKLAEVAKELQVERVLALTATATPAVLMDIRRAFGIDAGDAVRTPFFRPNLVLRSTPLTADTRVNYLIDCIKQRDRGPTLVYVTLQRTAEEVAEQLATVGLPARAYHAGMENDQRVEIQQWFQQSQDGIVVATIAFGMGIDKSNIRYVYHYNPAKSLEAYAQEVGRAGRDGKESICETLLVTSDRNTLDNFAYGDTPDRHNVRELLKMLAAQPETFYVSQYRLSSDLDIRMLVVRILLTYLELDGYLKGLSPRYESYQFRLLATVQSILSHFEGERRDFVFNLLDSATKAKTLYTLSLPVVARRLGQERSRLVKALDYLEERGWLELKVSDLNHGYRRLRDIADPDSIADQLHARLVEREVGEIDRTAQVFAMLSAKSCLAATLSQHFGESMEQACGRCSACRGDGPHELAVASKPTVGRAAIMAIESLKHKFPQQLATPRQQARFLCGLTTPALTRAKLTRDPNFGVCDSVPFPAVLDELAR